MDLLRCPICRTSIKEGASRVLPFCSQRCQQVDLGRWLGEQYGLPTEDSPEEDPLEMTYDEDVSDSD